MDFHSPKTYRRRIRVLFSVPHLRYLYSIIFKQVSFLPFPILSILAALPFFRSANPSAKHWVTARTVQPQQTRRVRGTISSSSPPPATVIIPIETSQAVAPFTRGYVAFGDSYAAGIGTGVTEGSGCRQGQYSYPKQLAALAEGNFDFQNFACSGAVVGELLQGGAKSQIDAWTNPGNADTATISIGGNDIWFYPILTACVIRVGGWRAGKCDDKIQKAYDIINGGVLFNDISSALHQIIDKSGRKDFKIFYTGYPTFFNDGTDICDKTDFYFWEPGHHGFNRPADWAYLYKAHRTRISQVVIDLDALLFRIINSVNAAYATQKPAPGRMDTWLFLSAWPDNDLPGTASAQESLDAEEGHRTADTAALRMPDPNTCADSDSTDWYEQMLCETAQAAALQPEPGYEGPNNASLINAELAMLARGEFEAVDVPFYIPTRDAKTFHPRSLGQLAYRDAVLRVWRDSQHNAAIS
ncbi:SGNH hydrolase [Aulographum hederae CBS 113979]|uniref:SGNH hydrolase n=1 Tax=Aulographum hederae CBS 113979 TaxID=1176131 RepID=A0A6G1GYT8_9PEZI|nr:SGNH hydrolase [Aulographum hederae CBS 113979]